MTLRVENGPANGIFALVVGTQRVDLQSPDGVLFPSPDVILNGLALDPSGEAVLTGTWTSGLAGGFTIVFQALVSDSTAPAGFSMTNGVTTTTP